MIEHSCIEELKRLINIVDVVSNYVELRRAGANYVANCPFHSEKTPSFVVSPYRSLFKCYGCGVGGDVINFMMQIENIEFYEAVEKLASMNNFELRYTTNTQSNSFNYEKLLSTVSNYYQNKLSNNREIIDYLVKRGINKDSINKFCIGYCGNSKDFMEFVENNNLPIDRLIELGVLANGNNGYYAKFNSRIIFPIFSQSNKIIGFGGRILSGDFAKYINSQQSKVFNKSRILYGYNFAKDSIFKRKQIIIVEGYIDVIMLFQAGYTNCVATLGTALTKDHIPLLTKSGGDILLCYDGDNAGINAAFKASLLLCDKSGGVIIFKDNRDPADMVLYDQLDELNRLFSAPIPFIEFAVNCILNKFDLKNPIKKQDALNEILDFYRTLSPLLQDEYRNFIALKLGIAPHLLKTTSKRQSLSFNQPNNHIVESIIIKSIIDNPNLLDFALEYINMDIFEFKKDEFQCLLNNDFNNQLLAGIVLDKSILAIDGSKFKEQLRLFILSFYRKKQQQLKLDKSINHDSKMSMLRDIQNKISILMRGALVGIG